MRIDIVTIFPEMFVGPLSESILKRARDNGLLTIHIHNLRDFTSDKHRVVDDSPFGGGTGMIMKPEPLFAAVEHIRAMSSYRAKALLMCPQGEPFSQAKAKALAVEEQLIFLCGRYEGIDERVRQHLVDEEISIGDYVLTGGELPAMVIIDAVARMLPGVLGAPGAAEQDSFYDGLLEYPQYTRPREFRGWEVPQVLLSGNHEQIRRWRRKQSLNNTLVKRPDLLEKLKLSPEDQLLLAEISRERGGG